MTSLQSMSKTVLGMQVLFLLLLGFSFLTLDPESASYVAAKVALVPVLLSLVASLVVLRTEWEPFE